MTVKLTDLMAALDRCSESCDAVHPRALMTAVDCKAGEDENACVDRLRSLIERLTAAMASPVAGGPGVARRATNAIATAERTGEPIGRVGGTMEPTAAALGGNEKTFMSVDCSPVCPKFLKNEDCQYCYRMPALMAGGLQVANIVPSTVFTPGDIAGDGHAKRGLDQDTIRKLHSNGGLRVFSFGDYIDAKFCQTMLDKMFEEALSPAVREKNVWEYVDEETNEKVTVHRPLRIKAITKRPEFVKAYAMKVAETGGVINLSIDTIGSGMPWKTALDLKRVYDEEARKAYPDIYTDQPLIVIRSTALTKDEVPWWGDREWVGIVTPFHGKNKTLDTFHVKPEFDPVRALEVDCELRFRSGTATAADVARCKPAIGAMADIEEWRLSYEKHGETVPYEKDGPEFEVVRGMTKGKQWVAPVETDDMSQISKVHGKAAQKEDPIELGLKRLNWMKAHGVDVTRACCNFEDCSLCKANCGVRLQAGEKKMRWSDRGINYPGGIEELENEISMLTRQVQKATETKMVAFGVTVKRDGNKVKLEVGYAPAPQIALASLASVLAEREKKMTARLNKTTGKVATPERKHVVKMKLGQLARLKVKVNDMLAAITPGLVTRDKGAKI